MIHYYTEEQDRIVAGRPIMGSTRPVQALLEEVTWEYVKGHDGNIVHTHDGMLMVNNHGEYASDTGFHLVSIDEHGVQQARVKHELRDFIN